MNVLSCEGPSEVQLIVILIENGDLIFTFDDILDNRPIHMRQPKTVLPLINILPPDEEIVFYRIGDTQREDFDISCLDQIRSEHVTVKKVCTKPEIEILIIINEHLYEEYMKVKSKMSPKQFVKAYIPGYTNFYDYISDHNMVWSIKEYKRIKQNDKDELYLSDLLKN